MPQTWTRMRGRTALVIEDKTLCWLIARALRKSGWQVCVAGFVGGALRVADQHIEIAFLAPQITIQLESRPIIFRVLGRKD